MSEATPNPHQGQLPILVRHLNAGFGGTANLKHIVVSQPDDDGLDWDFGWTGKVQFLVIQQNAAVENCAIEADSNKNNNDAFCPARTLRFRTPR